MISLLQGIPIVYSPRLDDTVTLLLLGCFFVTSFVLSHSGKLLFQLAGDYMLHRSRSSIFSNSSPADMKYLMLLTFQTCVLIGVLAFSISTESAPWLLANHSPLMLILCFVGVAIAYLFLKCMLYLLLGWTFFDAKRTLLWRESYFTLIHYFGLGLFPLVLLSVYFGLELIPTLVIGGILFVLLKILMIFKWLKLFCNDLRGCFLLFLYFCTLEIVPCLLIGKSMVERMN